MLKAVIVDANAVSRATLGTVLADGSYDVVGASNTSALGFALALKHHPHVICIAREQVEDGSDVVEQLRAALPKTLVFLVSGTLDAAAVQSALVCVACTASSSSHSRLTPCSRRSAIPSSPSSSSSSRRRSSRADTGYARRCTSSDASMASSRSARISRSRRRRGSVSSTHSEPSASPSAVRTG
jgi:two-component system chemotaxis response regulator CheY